MLYLPVEIKSRELHGKLLLAYHALSKGEQIIIGEHSKVEESAQIYPAGFFLAKGYQRSYMKRVVTAAKASNHTVMNLDEEGMIYTDPKVYLRTRMNRPLMSYLDMVFCWGKHQQKVIEDAYPEMRGKCISTGNPRFDLLTSKYREVYRKEAKLLCEKYGPYVLINTRFTLYNTLKGKKDHGLHAHGEYIRKLYWEFIDMIEKVSAAGTNFTFIIRPHPAERKESYMQDLKTCPNVIVKGEGAVVHWLLGAQALIHNGCTTGVEAYLLGRPVFSYEPICSREFDVPITQDVSVRINRFEDLKDQLWKLQSKKGSVHNSKSKILPEYCAHSSGSTYAYKQILGYMQMKGLGGKMKVKKIKHQFSRDRRKKMRHLFPSLTEKEMRDFFSRIDQVEGEQLPIQVTLLADRLFLLSPGD
ncbi:hypothetical protein J0K78_11085 [Halobacillus sp. GSS1]|uniref:surface carbohydrate biosynthesis protein n=1 Tax=Halobacillus sp. GSS1 TaxID=2815919 RepID=UPI001A8EF437|nr:surface carbohydrate biosynthesis protein [Halobacillus sp. GSS1]MBN9654810.1 hypothetical protein [Halobacillus sp. GSS1]